MKQILLSLAVLFATSVANAQDVFKLGTTVKEKHVKNLYSLIREMQHQEH